jgi:hypothetical protein
MPKGGGTSNGGVIGKTNKASFGKNTQTVFTSSCSVTTQPGTRVVQSLIVAGGGGSAGGGGGGGAGGLRNIEIPNSGNSALTVTVGAAGTGCGPRSGPYPGPAGDAGGQGGTSSVASCGTTYSATGGGAAQGVNYPGGGGTGCGIGTWAHFF